MSGKYKGKLKLGMFIMFLKNYVLLISFVAVYLGFLWLNEITDRRLWMLFAIILSAFFFSFVTNYYENKLVSGVFFSVYKDYRLMIGEKLKRAPMGYFNERSLSKVLSCFTNILKSLENFSQIAFSFTVAGMSVSFFVLIGMFSMSRKMGALALVLVIFAWVLVKVLFDKSHVFVDELHMAEADFSDALVDGIRGVSVIRTFPNLTKGEVREVHSGVYDTARRVRSVLEDGEMVFAVYSRVYAAFLSFASVVMIFYTAFLFTKGEIELAQALTLCVASFMLFGGLRQLENAAILLVKNPAHLDYLEEVFDVPKIEDGDIKCLDKADIEFRDVCFGYDEKQVINDLSFTIGEGSKTAIVGPSGSGKTTIINLIARFYDVDSGVIGIGGNDIRDYEVDALLRELSLVFQDVYLFSDSVKNNIRFAKPSATDEEIVEVCKKARCHEFISELADGYDTVVGEGGSNLSGGEKQRISIARALLKDANIILLDEATSSVDPENEYEIMAAIDELTKGKTVISIAHRLSTVKNADQILVIDGGKLVQEGRHDDLLKEDGIYRNFIRAREKAVEWEIC